MDGGQSKVVQYCAKYWENVFQGVGGGGEGHNLEHVW